MSNGKTAVKTDAAPGALGPYSQAIVAGGMVYCAGQIPLDPATGNIVSGGRGIESRIGIADSGVRLRDLQRRARVGRSGAQQHAHTDRTRRRMSGNYNVVLIKFRIFHRFSPGATTP